MIALKNEYMEKYNYPVPLCVGMAGGIATPESAAAAFGMGAAYILTGTVNQSCVEAGICEAVRKLLCQAEQADAAMAPAADMFEIGARVKKEIQDKFLLTSFEAAWKPTRDFFLNRGNEKEVIRAEQDPKQKMALVFRSYLCQSSRWAIQGTPYHN